MKKLTEDERAFVERALEVTRERERERERAWIHRPSADAPHACFCVGPQGGDPVCPCRMKHVTVVGGRYVIVTDLGPAAKGRGL